VAPQLQPCGSITATAPLASTTIVMSAVATIHINIKESNLDVWLNRTDFLKDDPLTATFN